MNDPQQTDNEEEWVQVGHYPSLAQAYDHGLVILAMGESCRVEASDIPGEFHLQAEPMPAEKIAVELDAYGQETAAAAKTPAASA